MKKLIRITTVPQSLATLLRNQLKYMNGFYEVSAISSSSNGYLKKFGSDAGIPITPIELTRKITLIKDLKAVWKLYKVFKKAKPFIVHTHTPKAGTLGMLAAYLARVPHRLHTIAGLPLLEASGLKRTLLNVVEKITYRCATKIYPNSFGLQQIILDHGFTKAEKLKVIGEGSSNGIDTSHFDPAFYGAIEKKNLRESLGITEENFVFLFVGRLVKDKGIHELIYAFDELSKNNSNVKLLLVGAYERDLDPIDSDTEKIIDTHPSIIRTGAQIDVRPYFSIAQLLVFPSYREGFPNVVMEAGSMGLATVATDINGCNEIIVNGKNGVIIPTKDKIELLKIMTELHEDEGKLRQLSSVAREMISSRYERSYIWSELLKEYKKLES